MEGACKLGGRVEECTGSEETSGVPAGGSTGGKAWGTSVLSQGTSAGESSHRPSAQGSQGSREPCWEMVEVSPGPGGWLYPARRRRQQQVGVGHSWEQFSSLSNSQLTKIFGDCLTKTIHQLGFHPGSVEELGTHGNTQHRGPSPAKFNFAFKPRLCFGWALAVLALKTHLCTSRCPKFPV